MKTTLWFFLLWAGAGTGAWAQTQDAAIIAWMARVGDSKLTARFDQRGNIKNVALSAAAS